MKHWGGVSQHSVASHHIQTAQQYGPTFSTLSILTSPYSMRAVASENFSEREFEEKRQDCQTEKHASNERRAK